MKDKYIKIYSFDDEDGYMTYDGKYLSKYYDSKINEELMFWYESKPSESEEERLAREKAEARDKKLSELLGE
jgi:hypothetical protein